MQMIKENLKKIGSIYKTGLSKVANLWQNKNQIAQMMNFNSKPTKPIQHAISRTK